MTGILAILSALMFLAGLLAMGSASGGFGAIEGLLCWVISAILLTGATIIWYIPIRERRVIMPPPPKVEEPPLPAARISITPFKVIGIDRQTGKTMTKEIRATDPEEAYILARKHLDDVELVEK